MPGWAEIIEPALTEEESVAGLKVHQSVKKDEKQEKQEKLERCLHATIEVENIVKEVEQELAEVDLNIDETLVPLKNALSEVKKNLVKEVEQELAEVDLNIDETLVPLKNALSEVKKNLDNNIKIDDNNIKIDDSKDRNGFFDHNKIPTKLSYALQEMGFIRDYVMSETRTEVTMTSFDIALDQVINKLHELQQQMPGGKNKKKPTKRRKPKRKKPTKKRKSSKRRRQTKRRRHTKKIKHTKRRR